MTAFGFGFEAGQNVLPLELAHLMHDRLGATRMRFMWQRPLIQKEKDGPLDLSFINPSIDNAIAAGLEPSGGLYFFNKWMTSAELTSYDCECTKGSVARSIKEAPQCYVMTFDSDAIQRQAAALWKEIGDRVTLADYDNEPGLDVCFHGLYGETPQQRMERWLHLIAHPFARGVRSVQPSTKFRTQLDEFCDYAHLLKVWRESGEPLPDEVGCHPYADVEAGRDRIRTMFDRDTVTGDIGKHFDLDRTTDAVIEKMRGEFASRLSFLWPTSRRLTISEIQHADNFELLRAGWDVTEHNIARYVTMHQVWPGTLLPGLPGGNGRFELTDEGERFSRQMMPARRRGVRE